MKVTGINHKGMKFTVGTRIYYTGDMANDEGFGTITDLDSDPQWGNSMTISMDDGRVMNKMSPVIFSPVYAGNGSTRFVTEEAYKTWHEAMFARFAKKN